MRTNDGLSDATLLIRFVGGDVSAYEALVARYEKPVFNFVRRMIGSREGAEDIAQETFVRVYEQAPSLRRSASFRPWLWSIAANLCRDYFKRQRYRHHTPIEGVDPAREQALSVPAAIGLEDAEIGRLVQAAVVALKPELRMVIVLREYEGLSYQEIADAAGCPPGTVKSRLFAARLELRKRLAFLMDDL